MRFVTYSTELIISNLENNNLLIKNIDFIILPGKPSIVLYEQQCKLNLKLFQQLHTINIWSILITLRLEHLMSMVLFDGWLKCLTNRMTFLWSFIVWNVWNMAWRFRIVFDFVLFTLKLHSNLSNTSRDMLEFWLGLAHADCQGPETNSRPVVDHCTA